MSSFNIVTPYREKEDIKTILIASQLLRVCVYLLFDDIGKFILLII